MVELASMLLQAGQWDRLFPAQAVPGKSSHVRIVVALDLIDWARSAARFLPHYSRAKVKARSDQERELLWVGKWCQCRAHINGIRILRVDAKG